MICAASETTSAGIEAVAPSAFATYQTPARRAHGHVDLSPRPLTDNFAARRVRALMPKSQNVPLNTASAPAKASENKAVLCTPPRQSVNVRALALKGVSTAPAGARRRLEVSIGALNMSILS